MNNINTSLFIPNYHELMKKMATMPIPVEQKNITLLIIDPQLTFSHPDGSLYVTGQPDSGGAHADVIRLHHWMMDHISDISSIHVSLDDHNIFQIFHPLFWINNTGEHPSPFTVITLQDVKNNVWMVDTAVAKISGLSIEEVSRRIVEYLTHLEDQKAYQLIIWPYHALAGSISSSIHPLIEEALFCHSILHKKNYSIIRKGSSMFSEQYSAFREEANTYNTHPLYEKLFQADHIIVAGEAKSHCVAWSLTDIQTYARTHGKDLSKIYVLLDAVSDVVSPEMDFSDISNEIYNNFAKSGMNMITTKDSWPFSL